MQMGHTDSKEPAPAHALRRHAHTLTSIKTPYSSWTTAQLEYFPNVTELIYYTITINTLRSVHCLHTVVSQGCWACVHGKFSLQGLASMNYQEELCFFLSNLTITSIHCNDHLWLPVLSSLVDIILTLKQNIHSLYGYYDMQHVTPLLRARAALQTLKINIDYLQFASVVDTLATCLCCTTIQTLLLVDRKKPGNEEKRQYLFSNETCLQLARLTALTDLCIVISVLTNKRQICHVLAPACPNLTSVTFPPPKYNEKLKENCA